jgi:AraC-like DNA-binding protein
MGVTSGQADEELTRPAIFASYLARLVELTARFGVEAGELLAGSGVQRAALEQPDAKVSPVVSAAIVERALALTREPGLGFYHGLQLKLSSHGSVGLLAMTSSTLGEVAAVVERYAALRSPFVRFHYYVEDQHAVLELADGMPQGAHRRFVTETVFTALVQMARTLLGRPVSARFELSYPEPEYFGRFAHLWPGPVRFGQKASKILAPVSILDESLQMADSVTAKRMAHECEEELARLTSGSSLLSDLRRQLRAARDGYPSLADVARARHVSERTLKRQLAARGTTYRDLVDELRRERAIELLDREELKVEQVAELLGYSEPANFHRAFRRWFGVPPDAWRKGRRTGD